MRSIRINRELKALLDWGCSIREDADVPFITKSAISKHMAKNVVIEDYEEYTTSGDSPVTFPGIPEWIDVVTFRAILAAYLTDAFEKWADLPALKIESERYKLSVSAS